MTRTKMKIICFLENDQGRDIEQLMGVIYYAEKILGYEVSFENKWNIHELYRQNPDLILLPNSVGSKYYFELSKYAYNSGIKVFALISEGNFRTDGTFNFWGYNTDKIFYEDFICLWSMRTLNYMKEQLPNDIHKLVLTGGSGFDRYKIYSFKTKTEFLKERKKENYKTIIGYAGWAFGKLFNQQGRDEILFWSKNDTTIFDWLEKQMLAVESILRNAIEKNKDTLFILKKHPNEANPSITYYYPNEMNRLKDYPNVIYLDDDSLNIHDLINISDIWTAFESTSAMESWLLDDKKPTIFINPDPTFNRDPTYKGTAVVTSSVEFQHCIDEFLTTGIVHDFTEVSKIENRKNIIESTIGFGDGLNHLRASLLLEKCITTYKPENKKKIPFNLMYFIRYYAVKIGSLFYNKSLFLFLPKFKKTIWVFEKHKMKQAYILKYKYRIYFDNFYRNNKLEEKLQSESYKKKLLDI